MSIYNPTNLAEVNEMCQWGFNETEIGQIEREFTLSPSEINELTEFPILPNGMMAQLCRKKIDGIHKFGINALREILEKRGVKKKTQEAV